MENLQIIKTIKHGLTELNIYNEENSLILLEIFKGRGMDVRQDNTCLQIQLSKDEIKELIDYLKTKV